MLPILLLLHIIATLILMLFKSADIIVFAQINQIITIDNIIASLHLILLIEVVIGQFVILIGTIFLV